MEKEGLQFTYSKEQLEQVLLSTDQLISSFDKFQKSFDFQFYHKVKINVPYFRECLLEIVEKSQIDFIGKTPDLKKYLFYIILSLQDTFFREEKRLLSKMDTLIEKDRFQDSGIISDELWLRIYTLYKRNFVTRKKNSPRFVKYMTCTLGNITRSLFGQPSHVFTAISINYLCSEHVGPEQVEKIFFDYSSRKK